MSITLTARPAWHDHALCRDLGPNLFYTDGIGQGVEGAARIRNAKAVCAECPVRDQCLEASMDEPFGVWGGTTPLERRRMRVAAGWLAPARRPIEHGTDSGYHRHRERHEQPCAECRAAHSQAEWAREKKRRNVDALESWADSHPGRAS